ncbi:amidohydrolase family protein [bacterium]|nr:amidohydrolase family protein [bacterium]
MAKKKNQQIIRATNLFNGERFVGKKTVVVEDNIIVDILSKALKADYEGIVTPAFIDPHSHIGMFRAGEPGAEQEGNDHIHQIRPSHDPLDGIYFDDRTFSEAVAAGVLYSCVIPGSGNVFGGRAKVIRNFAAHRGEAELLDFGYKMALGYNPRSSTGWKGERPNTRMGVYAMLEREFDEVLRKLEQAELEQDRKYSELKEQELSPELFAEKVEHLEREFSLKFSSHEMFLLDALSGNKTIKVHVHKEDDVLYLISLKEKYDLKVSAEHLGDVHHEEIFRLVRQAEIPIVFGPLGAQVSKVEVRHGYPENAALLMKSGAQFGLMTDHPVIHATALRDSTKFFLHAGMDEEGALSLITKRNAEVIGLNDSLGSIEKGLVASLLVWDRDPLHLAARPSVVIGEGEVLLKR